MNECVGRASGPVTMEVLIRGFFETPRHEDTKGRSEGQTCKVHMTWLGAARHGQRTGRNLVPPGGGRSVKARAIEAVQMRL